MIKHVGAIINHLQKGYTHFHIIHPFLGEGFTIWICLKTRYVPKKSADLPWLTIIILSKVAIY